MAQGSFYKSCCAERDKSVLNPTNDGIAEIAGQLIDMWEVQKKSILPNEELADYIDVFCDKGFFTCEQTERMLMQGIKYGLRPKIHANEMACSGGIQVGVKYNALSVDHLEYTGEEEIAALLGSETMPTILPGLHFMICSGYTALLCITGSKTIMSGNQMRIRTKDFSLWTK